jgi:hypothetical protein
VSGRGCSGLHCPGCGDGGGGALVAAVVILAIIAAVIHAIWHTLVEIAEIAAWTVLGIAGVAAAAGIGYAALRVRASVTSRRAAPRAVIIGEVTRGSISGGHAPAIEPPRHTGWPLPGQWEEIPTDTDRRTS